MHRITIEYAGPADPAAFDARYREAHVPLVLALPGLSRFTMTHPRGLGGEAPYLVAELWFDDADSMKTAMRSPEMAATAADAETYDVTSTTMFTGEVVDVS
ncbi:hypothetical protein GCM10009798_11480 [Nocardioides panacihumi]|uniref:EthD domain-containing protein n=1 Tax=Nocardioides panacihumi TaxID=400774 RepID=A0ABN2QMM8_9ACTN